MTGICVAEAIFLCAGHPATLLTFSPRRPDVSIGRFQVLERRFLSIARSEGARVVRRPRGGGLLLHTPQQVVFASITMGGEEASQRQVLSGVLLALEQLGLEGKLDGLSGVTVSRRRICEYTASTVKGFTCIFGVLLLDVDYGLMSILAGPQPELGHVQLKRLMGLVTSVRHEAGTLPDPRAARKALIGSISLSAEIKASEGRLSLAERRALSSAWKRLRSGDWLYRPARVHPSLYGESFKPRQAEFRSETGLMNVALRASDERVSEIGFSGSFIFYPEEKLEELESSLIGCELSEGELIERVSSFYLLEGVKSPGISPMDIAYAILRASIEI